MKNLFKYAAVHWKSLLAIIAVLFIQAYCDLSLPAYTSDIVNVGIQQGGIEDQVPEALRADEMEKLLLFVPEEDQGTVLDAYETDSSTYDTEAYVLRESAAEDEEQMDTLSDILAGPMMLTAGFESGSDMTKQIEAQLKENIPAQMATDDMTVFDILKMMPAEQRDALIEEMEKQMDDLPDTILEQAAVSYVGTAYEALGMDMDEIQIHYLLVTGGKMVALAFLGMAASVLVGFLASRVGAATGRDLRGNVFRKVVGFSNNEFDHFSTASLITRSTNDIQQIQLIVVMLLRIVLYAPILAIGGIIQVFQTNVSMSWIIGLAVVLIGLVILVLFLVAMPKFRILQTLVDKVNLVMREILTGLPVIRAFSTQKHEEERFDDANRMLTKTNLFVNRAMTFMMPVMMLIMNGVSVLIMWNGAHGIDEGQMQVGDMMAFIQYTMQIIMGFLMLCMLSIMLPRAAVAADRVEEVLSSRTVIHDPEQPKEFSDTKRGLLVFDHVSFKYPGADENVLHDITFTAKPGETTAIIGSTGSGKSTLVNLIPRFYDVSEGSITLDGVDIREVTQHELREKLGYVPQKGLLFSGDIASNIMFGNPDGSESEMIEAAEIAQAVEFIDAKPDGYHSHIAQGGSNVSGGQKQRLSIARAVAKHPEVFIFDDSFSALDFKTDVTLRKALKKRTKDSTVLIVAQRISTILNAEQIIVLDDGKVAGIGTHQGILRRALHIQERRCPVMPRGMGGPHGKNMAGEKAKDFKGTIKKLIRYMSAFKVHMFFVAVFAVCGTVFNIVGPKILGKATTEIFNGLVSKVSGGSGMDFGKIGRILLITLGLYLISALCTFIQGIIMTGVSQKTTYRLRKEISEKVNRMPMNYFDTKPVGEVLSRVTNDVDTLGQSLNQSATQMITSVTTLIGVLIMMLSISPLMTLVALLILPVSVILISFVMKHSQKYFRGQQAYLGNVNGQVEEIYSGHNIIKAFNKEDDVIREFNDTNAKLYDSAWKSQFFSGMMMPVMQFIGNLGYVGVAILGGFLAIRNAIEVGDIQSFIQYVRNFTQPIQQVAQVTNMLQLTAAASERVFEFLDEEEEDQTVPDPVSIEGLQGNVEFDHVHFGYSPDKIIINDFSAKVKEGQKIAIVGPTGAGKTTMIKLLMRFYDVNSGAIKIDGHDVRSFNRSELREMFGMVLQDTWLFHGTIMENIRYGKLDATDEEVIRAAKAAHVHRFVQTLPGGYNMELNEEATNVSQGQKQLLTIARAILADPKILILDEATSSVDTRTEVLIQKAMDNLMKGRTSFVIAHRLSTIRDADLILVMKDGDIVEQGTHEELLARNGFYADLYNSQFESTDQTCA